MMGSEARVCECVYVCMQMQARARGRTDQESGRGRKTVEKSAGSATGRFMYCCRTYSASCSAHLTHSHTIIRDFETNTLTTLPFPDAAHGLEHTTPDAQVRDYSCLCSQHFVIVPRVLLSLGLSAPYMYDAPTSVSYSSSSAVGSFVEKARIPACPAFASHSRHFGCE